MNGRVEELDTVYPDGTVIRGGRYDTRGNMKVSLGSLLSYEDKENGVARVEQQMDYETVAASQTGQVLGASGAAGDLLARLVLVVTTAATAAVSILDGATSIQVFPNSPCGGIGTYTIPLDLVPVADDRQSKCGQLFSGGERR